MITFFVGQMVMDLNIDHFGQYVDKLLYHLFTWEVLGDLSVYIFETYEILPVILLPMTKFHSEITVVLNKCTSINSLFATRSIWQ